MVKKGGGGSGQLHREGGQLHRSGGREGGRKGGRERGPTKCGWYPMSAPMENVLWVGHFLHKLLPKPCQTEGGVPSAVVHLHARGRMGGRSGGRRGGRMGGCSKGNRVAAQHSINCVISPHICIYCLCSSVVRALVL